MTQTTATAPAALDAQPPTPAEPTRLRLSFSRVDTYSSCPLRYRFGYVDKLPQLPSPHLSWGSSIHAALEVWWDQKLPDPPPVEVLYDALYEHWDDTGFAGMERAEKLRWYRFARNILARHYDRYAPGYIPAAACEQWFELDLGDDIEVVGSIDHVAPLAGGGIGIVDWKTNRRAKPRQYVASSLQLAIYVLAARQLWGREPEWVALDFVVPGLRVTVARDEIDVDAALTAIHETAALIRAERFEPRPSKLCGWCDYRAQCPSFEGEGPDVAGLAVIELERLQRQRARDEARIAELERIVRERFGHEATVEVGGAE